MVGSEYLLSEATEPCLFVIRKHKRSIPNKVTAPQLCNVFAAHIGDQASIIGGAIYFVIELEHMLHFLGAQKEAEERKSDAGGANNNKPFSEFFSFPQYSTSAAGGCEHSAAAIGIAEQVGEIHSGIADIEVTMVESHANLKIRSKKRKLRSDNVSTVLVKKHKS